MGSQDSGAQEWSCPVCGRRLRLRRRPHYEKIVLVRGDEHADHVGGSGGVAISAAAVAPAPNLDDTGWLDELGISWHRPAG